ncbi:MAG: hypothetical protein CXR31_09730 [Geobacter sp.]|nr:MAG: hypothetical protein CXR31_09730 [Geobacter sp.]
MTRKHETHRGTVGNVGGKAEALTICNHPTEKTATSQLVGAFDRDTKGAVILLHQEVLDAKA